MIQRAWVPLCLLAMAVLSACESAPITPAPIHEQSISQPTESVVVKPETVAKPASVSVKDASSNTNASPSKAGSAPAQDRASETAKQKQDSQDGAVATPLESDSSTIQSVPQKQRVVLDEKAKAPLDQNTGEPAIRSESVPSSKTVLPASTLNWTWPSDLPISQPFSEARKGVDFTGPAGQPVQAVASGVASYLGNSLRGYGQMVVIKHDQGFISVYANNSKILVKEGQKIERGQKIAETGHADGSDLALHFELRQQGKPLDPGSFFPARLAK